MSSEPRADVDEIIEETGLNLFDERASAAGSFPHTMLGYDRNEVDVYVREIEREVSTLKQLARHLRRELISAQSEAGAQTEFTRLGAHATGILRSAEAQASDLVSRAGVEAERIKEEGRRVAADLRASAQAEADDIRVAGLANLRKLRTDLDHDSEAMLQQTRAEAAAGLEAAHRQAAAIIAEAQRNANAIIEQANLEAAGRRQQGERAGAEALAAARKQAEEVLATAQTEHAEAKDRSAQVLAEAVRQQAEAREAVVLEGERAREVRSAALADAEQIKVTASREAESQMAAAHRHVAMMKDRLEEQFAWRKEQLEREVAALLQRKQSVIAQMGNLRELAGQSVLDYPDADPFSDWSPTVEPDLDERSASHSSAQGAGQPSADLAETRVMSPIDDRALQDEEAARNADAEQTVLMRPDAMPEATIVIDPRTAAEGIADPDEDDDQSGPGNR